MCVHFPLNLFSFGRGKSTHFNYAFISLVRKKKNVLSVYPSLLPTPIPQGPGFKNWRNRPSPVWMPDYLTPPLKNLRSSSAVLGPGPLEVIGKLRVRTKITVELHGHWSRLQIPGPLGHLNMTRLFGKPHKPVIAWF